MLTKHTKWQYLRLGIFCFLWVVALGALDPQVSHASILYVTPNGSGTQSGSSWADAKPTIEAAVGAAVSGDQIWIAAGTYHVSLVWIDKNLALLGGFAGNETSPAQR